MLLRLIVAWGINALALWVANEIFDGVRIEGWASYLIGAAALGLANALLKPLLVVLTFPVILLTLGLFLLVINIGMVALSEWVAPDFSVDGFWTYVGTVVVLWLVNWAGHALVDRVATAPSTRRRPSGWLR